MSTLKIMLKGKVLLHKVTFSVGSSDAKLIGVRVNTEIDVAPYICLNVRVITNCTAKRWITVMEVYTVLKSIFL